MKNTSNNSLEMQYGNKLFLQFQPQGNGLKIVCPQKPDAFGASQMGVRMIPATALRMTAVSEDSLLLSSDSNDFDFILSTPDRPAAEIKEEIESWLMVSMGRHGVTSLGTTSVSPAHNQVVSGMTAMETLEARAAGENRHLPGNSMGNPRRRLMLWGAASLGVVALLGTCSSALTRLSREEAAKAAASAAGGAAQIEPTLEPLSPDSPAHLSAAEKTRLEGLKGVIGDTSAEKKFYIFSDPKCPYCHRLEATIAEYKKAGGEFEPIVIPVGFQRNAQPLAEGALCSTDKKAAWAAAMVKDAEPATSCLDGGGWVQENEQFFRDLGLEGTPTMVIKDVLVSNGSGVTVAQLKGILGG